jgi:predicted glycoside hydrolase/deacetylase ChbG (UPF0249 family)
LTTAAREGDPGAPPRPRRLVVTADDAGLAAGMTAGAVEAAERGIVTAVAVTAVGADVAGALAALRARPHVDVAAHLVLVGEAPLSPASEVPSLVGRDGRLLPGFPAFVARWGRGGIALADVERELRRQLLRLLDGGLTVRQLNSHQHLHALPRILELVAALAAGHGVPFVRLPEDPALPARPGPRGLALRLLRALARRGRRRLPPGVRALDATVGLLAAGRLTGERLRALVPRLAGTCELVCHPGRGDVELGARYRWGYAWDAEREALCDPGLAEMLRGAGVELTSFSRLAGEAGGASPPPVPPQDS